MLRRVGDWGVRSAGFKSASALPLVVLSRAPESDPRISVVNSDSDHYSPDEGMSLSLWCLDIVRRLLGNFGMLI